MSKPKKQRIFGMPKGYDLAIHLSIWALSLFGLLMIASASMGLTQGDNRALLLTVIKQIGFTVIGFFFMHFLANRFKIKDLYKEGFLLIVILMGVALLGCLYFDEVYGAKAWIRLPIPYFEITIQPSEFAKVLSILVVAAYCGDTFSQKRSAKDILMIPLFIVFAYLFIILVPQHDFGSAAILFIIANICFLIPKNPKLRGFQIFLRIAFWVSVIFAIFILSPKGEAFIKSLPIQEYQKNRFISAIDPFSDQYGDGYHLVLSLIAISTGGWFGKGFGNSIQKYMKFPAVNSDFILAIVIEELGFVGFMALMFLYVLIITRLIHYAGKIKSEKAKIILVGIAMYFLVHIFFNIGGVTGLIPLTGVPLLMISAGGSSTIAVMVSIGLAQAIIGAYKRKELE